MFSANLPTYIVRVKGTFGISAAVPPTLSLVTVNESYEIIDFEKHIFYWGLQTYN